jgi:hypothetical protein
VPDQPLGPIKVNGLEVRRAAGDLAIVAAFLFDQHIDDASDARGVEGLPLLFELQL